MAIGLIAWGRFLSNGNRITVPAPSTDHGKPWLWDMLRADAAAIGSIFDLVQLPPWSLSQGGTGAGCDGYGLFQRRNLNGTRYGSLESLMAAIAALSAHGCETYGDLVLHQMIGENGGPGVFRYAGADGRTMNGRGQTTPGWFRGGTGTDDPIPPFCREDDVPVPSDDFPFGPRDQLSALPSRACDGETTPSTTCSGRRSEPARPASASMTPRVPTHHQCAAS